MNRGWWLVMGGWLSGVMLLGAVSCAVLKKKEYARSESALQRQSRVREERVVQSGIGVGRNLIVLDSANQRYVVEIVPSGEFLYSPEAGFRGRAEKVRMEGSGEAMRVVNDSRWLEGQASEVYQADSTGLVQQRDVTERKTKDTEHRWFSWYWVGGIAGLMVVMFIVVAKKVAGRCLKD